jgi:hypothetical protein
MNGDKSVSVMLNLADNAADILITYAYVWQAQPLRLKSHSSQT